MGAQEWPAGQVASVTITADSGETRTYGRAFWDAFNKEWVDAEEGRIASSGAFWTVTDVRPLVVLDPDDFGTAAEIVKALRQCPTRNSYLALADAIEAQTRPPRLAEPDLWAVVEAHVTGIPRRRWVHHEEGWWLSDRGDRMLWEQLQDPVLVRQGVDEP